jgi:hypothetical protein
VKRRNFLEGCTCADLILLRIVSELAGNGDRFRQVGIDIISMATRSASALEARTLEYRNEFSHLRRHSALWQGCKRRSIAESGSPMRLQHMSSILLSGGGQITFEPRIFVAPRIQYDILG